MLNMKIELNGKLYSVIEGLNLLQFLEEQELSNKKGIAVAINQEIIPKAIWDSKEIKENDKIMIIQATQGG